MMTQPARLPNATHHRLSSPVVCCAPAPSCKLVSRCADVPGPRRCESAIEAGAAAVTGGGESVTGAGGSPCVWLGGACVVAEAADCAEPWLAGESDYYGEERAFDGALCGTGTGVSSGAVVGEAQPIIAGGGACTGFADALREYGQRHAAALRKATPPGAGDAKGARLLVIRDHWVNVGMGFMPQHASEVLHACMAAGIYLYFENYGRYDWQEFFFAHGGLSTRWTEARKALWARRFAGLGGPHVIEVNLGEPRRTSGEVRENFGEPWRILTSSRSSTHAHWSRAKCPAAGAG